MKKSLITLLLFLSVSAFADYKYGNVTTGEIRTTDLPVIAVEDGSPMIGVQLDYWLTKGWRVVTVTNAPSVGCRVVQYAPQDIDGTNCVLTVAVEKNLAEEAAEQAAAAIISKSNRVTNVEVSQKDMLEIFVRVHNLKVPAQYKVTAAEAQQIVRDIVFQ